MTSKKVKVIRNTHPGSLKNKNVSTFHYYIFLGFQLFLLALHFDT